MRISSFVTAWITAVLLSPLLAPLLGSCAQDKSVDYRGTGAGETGSATTPKPTPKPTSRPAGDGAAGKGVPESDPKPKAIASTKAMTDEELPKTEEGWRKILTAEQFRVLREHGTERAFGGELWDNKRDGSYLCAGCGEHLFESETKFRSGTGWPSFFKPASEKSVETKVDGTLGMERVEVHCKRCGGHLGHVFDDGPRPTGQRYCINSASLKFQPKE